MKKGKCFGYKKKAFVSPIHCLKYKIKELLHFYRIDRAFFGFFTDSITKKKPLTLFTTNQVVLLTPVKMLNIFQSRGSKFNTRCDPTQLTRPSIIKNECVLHASTDHPYIT